MPETTKPVSELTNEELDRAVAVEVMERFVYPPHVCGCYDYEAALDKGLPPCPACNFVPPPDKEPMGMFHPSKNPTDDYAVLKHVRETWGRDIVKMDHFRFLLTLVWRKRFVADDSTCHCPEELQYQPGDYARAALQTVREGE